ncbi:trimeric autotransporter adhesin Ata [Acinetobacter nosocomialis]|uniref:trimeric autotransporter adhesin Ata n=1 Tax=Acinetobacter nosocomialis TaxID=106654 RepID=UPI001250BF33|nr:trimeric autotransporter adhesin Ata [Acinetobacter nosocomialis]
MNKVYKVIWNASIGAWVATSEIAKGKTKTKSKTLNVSAVVLTSVISFAPNAFAGTNTEGGVGQGTSISGTTSCREGNASTANEKDVAIGCGAQTQDRMGSNIANRNNPYNNSTGAYAGAMKQGGAISVGTGAVVEKGLGTAIGSYATTQGISGVAIGTGALSSGNTALALGRQSAATADFSQAIGNVAAATGKGSLAIGHSATAEGYRSIAIGSPDIENADPVAGQAGAAYQPKMATKATGKDSIAFGGGAVATEENALAIGAFSESKGKKSIAIGTGAKAQKDNAVVIGDQAEATFDGGVAIGKGARSEAENSIALGKDSKAVQATGESFLTKQSAPTGVLSIGDVGSERRIQNVADGAADSDAATIRQLKAARTHYVSINDNGQQGGNFENDGATGRNAIAVGVNTSATAREAMAIGAYAQAAGSGAISMGSSSQTIGRGDVAIGRNASTKGAEGTPSGYSNQSIAIGDQTKAIGDQSIAIGADVIAKGNSSVAIGGDDVDKIAQDADLSKTYTEITGGVLKAGSYPTTEANHGSTAVGVQAVGTGAFSSAFGMTSKATGDASSAFGVMSNASGKGAAAFGAVAQATGDGASAMGINSLASGTNSTAIGSGNKPGEGAKATGNSAAAIGSGAQATGDNSAAIGKGAEATNENAAAVGGGAKAKGKNAAAIGGGAIADQENAVAVGQGAQSLVEGGVALGARSKVEAKNSVALGQDAVATEATGSSFLTNRDASKSNGVISVGSAGKERRITNVEDGSADSDAVTVRQLKNVDGRVSQNASNISKNAQNITNLNQKLDDTKTDFGNQITDTNTKLNNTKDQLTTQINDTKTELNNTIGNTKTELNSKIDSTKTELENKGLNFAGNSGADVHRKLGEKLNIVGGADASTPAAKTSGENVITRTTQDGIQIELLKDSKFDSVTTGNTTINTNGLTIKEGPSITKEGINAGGKQITNVADGVNAKDAVNKGQLDDLAAKQNATDDAAVKYDDAKTKDKVTLKGKDGTVLDNVKAGNISSTSKEAVNGSQIHNISNSIKNSIGGNTVVNPDGSLTTNNIGGTGKNNINDAIKSVDDKVTNVIKDVENKGLNFAANSGADVHRKLGDKLNIVGGADASTPASKTSGENVITRTTQDGIQIELLKDSKFDSVTTGNTTLNNNGLTIKEGPSITKEGINAGGKQITNVADGVNAKDAVNKGQLDDLAAKQNATDDAAVKYDDAKTKDKVTLKGKDGTVLDNVKAGNISSTSKEAVNGSQIHNISNSIKNSIGGNTVVNPDGSLTTNNIGGTGKNNINDAISEVKNTATKAKTTVTEGDNIVVKQSVNKDGSTNYEVATKKDLTLDSVTTGDSILTNNGLTIKDGPSMTKDGINAGGKKITNVANGVIAQNSKDAVNGGQVHNISTSIKNSIGGNTVVNPDGSLTTNNIGGTGKNNINDAIKSVDDKVTNGVNDLTQKGLNFGANDQKATQGKAVHRKLGDTINIVGGANPETAEDRTSGENIITRTTQDGIKIEMLKDVKFDSVNVGGHVLNQQGLIIKGGPSITVNGINAGGKQITNVADGVNAKDAVNKGQLDKQINEVKDQIGKDIGKLSDHAVQYDKDKNGNVDKNSVTLGGGDKGTNLKNVADGKVAEGSKDAVNGGQLWNVQNQVDKNSNDIKYIQNNIDNISNGKAGLVQQQKPNGEITVGKDTGGTSVNMAGKDGDRVVQGVKDGEIKAGSNQAVNGGQIHNISNSIKNSIGGNTSVNSDGSITTKNIGGTGKDNINDAIGTLNQSNQELGNKITNLGDQLQQVFYDTNKRIDDVEKKANAGIAAAMALENAPFVAGKYTYAVGAAYHGGENAVGVTLRKTSDNGRWSITGGVAAASQGEPSVRIGISGVIN